MDLTVTLPGGRIQELREVEPRAPGMGFEVLVEVPGDTPAGTATVDESRYASRTFSFEIMS